MRRREFGPPALDRRGQYPCDPCFSAGCAEGERFHYASIEKPQFLAVVLSCRHRPIISEYLEVNFIETDGRRGGPKLDTGPDGIERGAAFFNAICGLGKIGEPACQRWRI